MVCRQCQHPNIQGIHTLTNHNVRQSYGFQREDCCSLVDEWTRPAWLLLRSGAVWPSSGSLGPTHWGATCNPLVSTPLPTKTDIAYKHLSYLTYPTTPRRRAVLLSTSSKYTNITGERGELPNEPRWFDIWLY